MIGSTTRRGFLATAGSAALLTATGCGQSGTLRSGGVSNVAPGVLNFGNGAELSSVDPHHIEGTWEVNVVGEMLMGLTTEDVQARPIPGAAERWEISPDGKTWTFHLRDHLWSDGQPVTAHDFIYAWRRILDPKTAAQYASLLYVFKNAEPINGGKMPVDNLGARALDDKTLELTLEHPAPYVLQLMMHQSTYPVPRHVVEAKGDAWSKAGNYVGNGPYILREWIPNDHITLYKNPRFFDAANVSVQSVNFYPISDANSAVKQFRAGELDVQGPGGTGVPIDQLNWIKKNLPECLQIGPYLGVAYIVPNLTRKPFNDVRVREALNLCYDRDTITNKIIRLGEPPAYTIVPPEVANYPNENAFSFKSLPQAERVKRAQELMRHAGYGPDNRVQTTYSIADTHDARRIAAVAQQMWKQAYIDVELIQNETRVNYKKMQTGDFDLGGAGWIADYDDAYSFLFLLMSDNDGFNYGHYHNPKFDELMARSNQEPDAEKRGEIMSQAEAIALADFALIPTRYQVTSNLVRPYIHGWEQNNRDFHRIRYVRIDEAARAATLHS